MDPPSRLHPNKAFPLCFSLSVTSCRALEHEVTTSSALVLGRLGLFSLTWSALNLFKWKDLQLRFKHMRSWCSAYQLGFKRKDIFDMDSTEGTSMITVLINDLSQLSLRPTPVPKWWDPEPKRLNSLCSPIYSVKLVVNVSRRVTASLDYQFWDPHP